MPSQVVIMPSAFERGWDSGPPSAPLSPPDKDGKRWPVSWLPVMPLEAALAIPHHNDAHFLPYRMVGESQSMRVNHGGLRLWRELGRRLAFDVLVLDLDPPDHGKGWSADQIASWQRSTLTHFKEALPEHFATAGWYATRVGLRALWELPGVDESTYLGLRAKTVDKLTKAGVPVDKSTKDYTRCYRLPRVVRDGQQLAGWVWLDNLDELPDLQATPIDPLAGKRLEIDGPLTARELPTHIANGSKNDELMGVLGYARRNGANSALLRGLLDLYINAGLVEDGETIPAKWRQDALRSAASWEPRKPEGREYVRWSDVDLEEIARRCASMLGASRDLLQRGRILVRAGRDDERRRIFAEVSKAELGMLISRVVELTKVKVSKTETVEHEIKPPPELVDAIFHAPLVWDGVPVARGMTACPILRQDGTVLDTPGFDEASGYFYDPGPVVYPAVPELPTWQDARAAMERVCKVVLGDYRFARPEHTSVALAIPLTVLARRMFDGPTPLFLIDASTRGSGKSLLAKAWGMLLFGHSAATGALVGGVEMEKRISGWLRDAAPMVVLDDIKAPIGAEGMMDLLITADVWTGRILGVTKMITVHNRTCWVATGNNAKVGGDMERRTLLCRIDPGMADPASRQGLPDLYETIPRHRPQLVVDLLTMLRAFYVAGMPQSRAVGYGSFNGWSRVVRHCLMWLGCPDPVLTRREVQQRADDASAYFEMFMLMFSKLYAGRKVTARDIIRACAMSNSPDTLALRDALTGLGAYSDAGDTTAIRIGKVISQFQDRRFGNSVLRIAKIGGRQHFYTVSGEMKNASSP